MNNFNFRDLGPRNGRKIAATRIKHYTRKLRYLYDDKTVQKCNKVLQSCIDFSNGKISRNQLRVVHQNFHEEFLGKGSIPKLKMITTSDITRAYLLLLAIHECSRPTFYPRITFNLINGYAAMSGWYISEKERIAQTSSYNRYMRKRQRTTQEIIKVQQPNVLYPNRQISLGEE